jgi:iron complex outermembrane receptor protein
MNRPSIFYWTLLLLILTQFAANAQTLSVQQDSVIIRDNRMQLPLRVQNRNISVLTAEEIKQLPVKSVNELLTYVAGIDMRQRGPWGSQADVTIDGSTFDQVLVLINGVKISDPQTGHNMMNLSMPIGAIDHIEVLRGPAARVYGVNALAGAINIVTVAPQKSQAFARVYAGSSFQKDTASGATYYGWGAQAEASLVSGSQTNTIALSHDEGNGYRYNTAYKSNKLFYQNHTTLGRNSLEAFGIYSRNDFGANGYYSAPGDKESKEAVETVLGSVGYNYNVNDRIRITPRISYRYNKDDYIYIRQKPDVYHNIHETSTITGELQSSIKTQKGKIGVGAEWRNEHIGSNSLGKRERSNVGIYAEYRHWFTEKLNASAGLYANYNTDYGWQLFPGADAGWMITNRLKLFASFTTGQRLPTYTDLYYKGPLNIGNEQLKPEHSIYGTAGLRYQQAFASWKASYFYRHVSDLIDWVRASDSSPWQPENFQMLNTSGATLELNYPLSSHLKMSEQYKIGLNISYTYLNQEIVAPKELNSKYAIEALRHQLICRLNTTWFQALDINVAARYQQRISYNDYTILDLHIAYHLQNWQLYADLNNLSDAQYKEIGSIPMPGRWVTLGLQYTY